MYEYKFLAIVHPERVKFRLSLPSITLHFPELNLTGQFKIDSTDSHSTILFVTDINLLDHPSKDVLVSLKNILGNKARFFIDIFC